MATQARPLRVLLVDDHPAVLRQVMQLLEEEFEVVGALQDGTTFEAAVARDRPDLVVLDIALPGRSGIELARRLTETGSSARIVFLTVHADPDYVREAFAVGASAYVVKPRLGSDLLPALRAVWEGRRFLSPGPEFGDLAWLPDKKGPRP